jgi:hypothetical protein
MSDTTDTGASTHPSPDPWGNFTKKTKQGTAHTEIDAGGFAHCHICAEMLRRVSPTIKWCAGCGNGFCDDHGNFSQIVGKCFVCGMTNTKLRDILGARMGVEPNDFKIIKKLKSSYHELMRIKAT